MTPETAPASPVDLIAQAIRDEAKHYPGTDGCEDRCGTDEDVCMAANIHLAWGRDGDVGAVYASPERIAEVAVAALGLSETAPAECSPFAAGNGTAEGGLHSPPAAPASAPAPVAGGDRADVARVCERCRRTRAEGTCCSSHGKHLCHECHRRTHFVEVCDERCEACRVEGLPVILTASTPVARTLDVAEATVALALNSAPPVTPVERGGSAPPR